MNTDVCLLITGSPPAIVSTTTKTQKSPSNQSPDANSSQITQPKLVFTFEGPVAESYLNQPDNSRTPSRLTNSSAEGDRASEAYDSDCKSCVSSVVNSYIEGVSLNSR